MSVHEKDDAETGLPGLRTWKAVYLLVLATFCLWMLGLLALAYRFA